MKGREKMKKNSKQILAFALLISVVMSLSACGNKKSGKSDSESTDIVWYVMGSRQKDQDAVMDEINKKLNEKYQLNLELNVVDSGAYSDKMPHLHFHLVPKYEDGPGWGGTFEMMPSPKVLLSDEEYTSLIDKVRENL